MLLSGQRGRKPALGRRIYAYDAIAGAGRYFCYNNNWQVLEEYDDAGYFAWVNIFGNYIDEVLVRAGNYYTYYYAHNHLHSPVAALDMNDANGTVLERYDYDAYGTTHIMDASYTARTASAAGNPYSFTGRELDTFDGGNFKTMHYRYRSYDPFVGRFGQQDPIGYRGGKNLYGYVKSWPITSVDPYGLFRLPPLSLCVPKPPRTDQKCCDDFKASGQVPPSDGGLVLCCDGKKVSCAYDKVIGVKDPSNPPDYVQVVDIVLQMCKREHEDSHHDDVGECPKLGGVPYSVRPPFLPGKQVPEEIKGNQIELSCLQDKLAACSGTSEPQKCRALINQAIQQVNDELNRWKQKE